MTVPTAPWTGRPAERERTATGELIVRGRCGAFYQPHGAAALVALSDRRRARGKLFRKPGAAVGGGHGFRRVVELVQPSVEAPKAASNSR